jgi:hypothetical protein
MARDLANVAQGIEKLKISQEAASSGIQIFYGRLADIAAAARKPIDAVTNSDRKTRQPSAN